MKTGIIGMGYRLRPGLARYRRGLTLPEILVVVLIIAVLAALMLTGLKRARTAARSTTCMSNVKQVGMAMLMHAADNNNKLINLGTASAGAGSAIAPAWPRLLATAGYLTQWDGKGNLPCGTGVWTCPEATFVTNNYGAYGVVEGTIFVSNASSPTGVSEKGSLRLSLIADPANTWLLGDCQNNANDPKKGWYAIWPRPAEWMTGHGPAFRHGEKANVCMVDGHVESLTRDEIIKRKLTEDVLGN